MRGGGDKDRGGVDFLIWEWDINGDLYVNLE